MFHTCVICDTEYQWQGEHYCVRSYRYKDKVTVWLGSKYGRPIKSRTVNLKVWVFRSPAERIKNLKLKYQKVADELNRKEMYYQHEVELSER